MTMLAAIRRMALGVAALGLAMPSVVTAGGTLRAQEASAPMAMMLLQGAPSAGEKTTPESRAADGKQEGNKQEGNKQEAKDENYEYTHSAMVTKLGKMMGMSTDAAATTFTVFNFLILVGAIGYLMLKTLPKAFRDRSTTIQKHLVDARTATEEASARLNAVEARLAKLDDQIGGMRTQAAADTARDEQRIRAGVDDERAKIVAAAEIEIENATTHARREIQRYAVEMAVEQAARKLVISADTDRMLVEDFAKRLGEDMDSDKGSHN